VSDDVLRVLELGVCGGCDCGPWAMEGSAYGWPQPKRLDVVSRHRPDRPDLEAFQMRSMGLE